MTVNTAKQKMLNGEPAIGVEVNLGSPLSAELLSPLGFDFILVDNQHGAWEDEGSMYAFRSIGLGTAMPMARVRRNEFGAIGRLLDRGAMGIVVPMVNSVEEAKAAAEATRYPPIGGRSGGAFATGFLGPDYMSWANDEVHVGGSLENQAQLTNALFAMNCHVLQETAVICVAVFDWKRLERAGPKWSALDKRINEAARQGKVAGTDGSS